MRILERCTELVRDLIWHILIVRVAFLVKFTILVRVAFLVSFTILVRVAFLVRVACHVA